MVTQARKRRPGPVQAQPEPSSSGVTMGMLPADPQVTMTAEEFRQQYRRPKNKYGAKKCQEDGYTFDSLGERRRYRALKLMVAAGEITALEVHPRYPMEVNGFLIGKFTADFRYRDRQGLLVVEDYKSRPTRTEAYGLRKRLIKALYDIDLVEVSG